MKEYDFTLKYRLTDTEEDPASYLDLLAKAGCNDALVGIGQNGRVALHFIREASSAFQAITSAISDVQKAIPESTLVEAAPDFVGVSDLAELFRFSRQYMRKFIAMKGAEFPEPIHEGKPSLWHLSEVLIWIKNKESWQIEAELCDVAEINMQLNISRSCAKVPTLMGLHKGKVQLVTNDLFSTGEVWNAQN